MGNIIESIFKSIFIAVLLCDLIRYTTGFKYYYSWFLFVMWLVIAAIEIHSYVIKKKD
jgi:hypothetical protein